MSGSSTRRRMLLALGSIFIVGGLVAAVVLWNSGTQRQSSTIGNFARAPIGCDTTLDFIEPGDYLLFVETTGTLGGVRGDCDVDGDYESDDDDPDVEITLVDPDGDVVDLDRSSGDVDYDADGFQGVARFSIEIEETDDHVLRAESDADDVFVVAVGRDPSDGVAALRVGAVAAGLVGLLVGLALVLLGSRSASTTVQPGQWTPAAAAPPGSFVPGGLAPQGPPVYGQQGGPPHYAQQPPVPQPQAQPGAPTYGQPHPQQQPWAQQPYPSQPPPPQPPSPQYPSVPPQQPNLPGQPAFPQAPVDPAGSAQPIEWEPQPQTPQPQDRQASPARPTEPQSAFAPDPRPAARPADEAADSAETAPPDADFLAQLREERRTQERPAPPPPD